MEVAAAAEVSGQTCPCPDDWVLGRNQVAENEEQVRTAVDGEQEQTSEKTRKSARRNAWGCMSYAELITQAILSSPEKRRTLSQIYEWMVDNVPYFKDKRDSNSSAGWKVSTIS